jgi:hypothetical protein
MTLPSRDEQIALMLGAEERARGHFERWLANPEFKAALHRHDPPARPVTSFSAGLAPEQQTAALAYDGPDDTQPT